MKGRIISALFFSIVVITSIPLFCISVVLRIITPLFDRKLKLLHLHTCFWASIYTWMMPGWRIKVEGRENIRKDATYMVVSNHQSQLDILVAFRLFFHFKWVSKIEIFKVPLIGWNMRLNRYIKLRRGDRESIQRMFRDCEQILQEGSSIYFFPEGTRSFDGIVKPFKPGAFDLAKKFKLPILPIAISGTNKALPKHSIEYHGIQNIIIRVYEEIPYEVFAEMSVEETAECVRGIIVKHLDELNARIEEG